MKLVFIVSSLEPGRDGVGDYTRRLAAECIRLEHHCRLLALNDRFAQRVQGGVREGPEPGFLEIQNAEGAAIECLRLNSSAPWSERVASARKWIEEYGPDWVSLQFVAFGFHPKGLCFGLGGRLAAINARAPWQIMFHELWLGLDDGSSLKHRIWGAVQRRLIHSLFRRLAPRKVHTQAEPYRQVLKAEGIDAALLPLFGNIPFRSGNGWEGLLEPMLAKSLGRAAAREEYYLAGIFGAVHPEWEAAEAVGALLPLVLKARKRLVLVFMGRNNLGSAAIEVLGSKLKSVAPIAVAGEKSPEEISRILQTLDIGLATSPELVVQKSGSIAAMLEHGLPVLVSRNDYRIKGVDFQIERISPRLFTRKSFELLKALPDRARSAGQSTHPGEIARQLLDSFSSRDSLRPQPALPPKRTSPRRL